MLKGNDLGHLYRYLSGFIGRPVYSHEIPAVAEAYREQIKQDFLALCRNATDTEVDADGLETVDARQPLFRVGRF